MKRARTPSATSLPQSPHDEAAARIKHYAITMSIRVLCFALMVLVTPYGWYTWAFAIGAAVLPYVAVIFANNGASRNEAVESPKLQLPAAPAEQPPASPDVIQITERDRDDAQ